MTVVGVDLGKTSCRVRIVGGGPSQVEADGPGARGLAEVGGVASAAQAVIRTVELARIRHGLGSEGCFGSVAVGAAGAEAAPTAGRELAQLLAGELPCDEVAVTSDATTSHVGALGGEPGAMLAIGTGAVAVGVGASGVHQIDGWGYWLGDDGAGSWIGRAALRAALLAADGRGASTALVGAAVDRYGDLVALPRALAASGDVAARTAAFVPDVVRCAGQGDEVAHQILAAGADLLAGTAVAAARRADSATVTAVGGLTGVDQLMELWRARLPDGLVVVPALGTALDGAVMLAGRTDLAHEATVLRVRAGAHRPAVASPEAPTVDVDLLATEQTRPELADLDQRSPQQLVDVLLQAEATVPAAVAAVRTEIAAAVALAEQALAAGGRLVYVGAGTPGRLAALDAAECPPTFGTSPDQVVAVLAGGGGAAAAAVEGAEDDAEAGARDIRRAGVSARDVVVGISASGRTPYVLAALAAAHQEGAHTVAIVNNPGSAARDVADVTIELLTGAEVLSGSTRMKCGTAQKVVLNVISTSAMVRSGKSYGAWMVDVQASNEKLRRRARRILREAAGVDDATAARVLAASGWRTKTALVGLLAGVDQQRAQARLDAADGRVRAAVDSS